MKILKWNELPECMKCQEVRMYYNILCQKKKSLWIKRLFDIIMSFLGLIILSPVFIVLAIWIKVDSKGPVFFRQERVTQYGRKFWIFKFRTMINKAEMFGSKITVKDDGRITRVGSKIRKCRLDEIPQLINILLGDMSFVGTRPEVQKYVDAYTNDMKATLLLPAGVTSLASIKFKDEDKLLDGVNNVDKAYIDIVLPQKMNYNLRSIEEFSLYGETKTLIMTLINVF